MMEDFFDQSTHNTLVDGRSFNATKDADTATTYGKNTFATKVVRDNKASISFEGFKPILGRVINVVQHHKELSGN